MPSIWIERRTTAAGLRYRVRYRTRGHETPARLGGTFKTRREAELRARWVAGELAACRVPDPRGALTSAPVRLTVREVCERWAASRIDVAESTRTLHRVALGRVLPTLGNELADELTPARIAEWIAALHGKPYARGSIQKSLAALAGALDHHGVDPNPARDRHVRLPREDRREVDPPSAIQVETALGAVAPRYRLPLLVIEATAMRVGELEALRWGGVDEREGRWRVSGATAKTRRARWVQVPPALFARVLAILPREDRDPEAPVFPWVEQARLRTDLGRACKATGVRRFGLHDLRHRRLSIWHNAGVPLREVAARAGHARTSMTLDVYAHVLVDDRELDAEPILGAA